MVERSPVAYGEFTMAFELKAETISTLQQYYKKEELDLNWPHVFVLPVWLQSWWEAFGQEYRLWLRSIWQEGALIGLAPLMVKGGEARLIGSADVCDYLDFITIPGREKAFFQALVPALQKAGFKNLILEAQRPEAVFFKALAEIEHHSSIPAKIDFIRENEAFEVALPHTWEDYLALLSKKQRHEVKRKLRRLDREAPHYGYQVIAESEEVQKFVPTFLTLLQEHPDKAEFLTPQMEHYFKGLIDNMSQAGLARFGLFKIDGFNAAAVLYFDYGGRIYLFNSGYITRYRPLSAGLISKLLLINEAISQGRQVYDFLKGREVYKSRLGGTGIPIFKVELQF